MTAPNRAALEQEIKQLIIDSLNLEDLTPDDIDSAQPLFKEGLGLDSIDALEIGLAFKKKYEVTLSAESEEMRSHFRSVATLADYLESQGKGATAPAQDTAQTTATGSAATVIPSFEELSSEQKQIYAQLVEIITSLFDVTKEQLTLQATLFEELDLDSIDAIDLAVQVQKKTGKQVTRETFAGVRTVYDVILAVEKLLKEGAPATGGTSSSPN